MKRTPLSRITVALLGAALFVSACGDGTDNGSTPAQPDPTTTATTPTTTEGWSPSTVASDSVAVPWPHDWTEERIGGGQFDAGDYEGQDLVLWFWAPW